MYITKRHKKIFLASSRKRNSIFSVLCRIVFIRILSTVQGDVLEFKVKKNCLWLLCNVSVRLSFTTFLRIHSLISGQDGPEVYYTSIVSIFHCNNSIINVLVVGRTKMDP